MKEQGREFSTYYFDWLRSRGTTIDQNLAIVTVDGKGRGLYLYPEKQNVLPSSTIDIKSSTDECSVAKLPRSLVITAQNVHQIAVKHWPVLAMWIDGLAAMDDMDATTYERSVLLALIIHHSRVLAGRKDNQPSSHLALADSGSGSGSETCPFLPFVATLPDNTELPSPVLWPSSLEERGVEQGNTFDCLALLEGTSLGAAIIAKKRFLQTEVKRWQAMCKYTRDQHDHSTNNTNNDDICYLLNDITHEELIRADALYWSRVLEITSSTDEAHQRGTTAFLPLIDMCNHAGEQANARWQLTPEGDVELLVSAALLANTNEQVELCISYGDKTNEELLFLYGFTLSDTRYDSCTLMAPLEAGNQYVTPTTTEQEVEALVMGKMYLLQAVEEWKPQLVLRTPSTGEGEVDVTTNDTLNKRHWCPWLTPNAERVFQLCMLGSDEFDTAEQPDNKYGLEWTVYDRVLDKFNEDFDKAIDPHRLTLQQRMIPVLYELVEQQLACVSSLSITAAAAAAAHHLSLSSRSDDDASLLQDVDRVKHIHNYLTGIERVAKAILHWLNDATN
ncbi:hypothetical protein BDF22DRAFT_685713 [Syncephalis plumigaleata]|nr:hypothetical protein BDF22DRAFT_685713 [Syncephalis plumigaleata]